jgi:hypothetical protein
MQPLSVVNDLDVLKNALSGFIPILVLLVMDQFGFQGLEERLRNSIVITVSGPAHALNYPIHLQFIPETMAGILDASIGVENQVHGRISIDERYSTRAGISVVSVVNRLLNEWPTISRLNRSRIMGTSVLG